LLNEPLSTRPVRLVVLRQAQQQVRQAQQSCESCAGGYNTVSRLLNRWL